MTAAFVLSINMFIAALFAVAFTVVASTNPTVRGARWLAAEDRRPRVIACRVRPRADPCAIVCCVRTRGVCNRVARPRPVMGAQRTPHLRDLAHTRVRTHALYSS